MNAQINVVIRKRPINENEIAKGEIDILSVNDPIIQVEEPRQKVDLERYIDTSTFRFDKVFDNQTNRVFYEKCIKPQVRNIFLGQKFTCFAYGQTGSGKTYTMMGQRDNQGLPTVPGIYLLSGQDIFSFMNKDIKLYISFTEIYNGKCFDLINKRSVIPIREGYDQDVNLIGIKEVEVKTIFQLEQIINLGMQNRATDQTGQNDQSSRSHAILNMQLRNKNQDLGKISFVDLAGSERACDIQDQSHSIKLEGAEINKSLLTLKECIRAMDLKKKHLPFRGSKLTLILRDSFIGNSKTLMIAHVSPGSCQSEQTLNTLRYAVRVKQIKQVENNSITRKNSYNQTNRSYNNEKDEKLGINLIKQSLLQSQNFIQEKIIKSNKNLINNSQSQNNFLNDQLPNFQLHKNDFLQNLPIYQNFSVTITKPLNHKKDCVEKYKTYLLEQDQLQAQVKIQIRPGTILMKIPRI